MITRREATERILEAKQVRNLSFEEIAEAVGRHTVWVTAALLAQATMSEDEAVAVTKLLGLDGEVSQAFQQIPMRGSSQQPEPMDPLIYRFHELIQVYGTTLRAIINEMFGDGIMSAIDFELDIQRKTDPKGDRIIVTLDGKFLPYRKW